MANEVELNVNGEMDSLEFPVDPNTLPTSAELPLGDLLLEIKSVKVATTKPNTTGELNRAGKVKVGDEVEGKVTGMVDFGVFVKIDEGLEGLVHISEIDWALVDDPKTRFKVGDKVRVKVIEVKDGKVLLTADLAAARDASAIYGMTRARVA